MNIHDRSGAVRPLLGLGLAALLVAGCGRAAPDAEDAPRVAAARFLDDVREGRFRPAWDAGSTEFKSLMGVETLRDLVKAHPALKSPAESVESRATGRNGPAQVECVFRANANVRGKAVPATIRVLVAPDVGVWKVERVGVE